MTTLTTTIGASTDVPAMPEISAVYEQLGLASASDRAMFSSFFNKPSTTLNINVVVTTTSKPFGD